MANQIYPETANTEWVWEWLGGGTDGYGGGNGDVVDGRMNMEMGDRFFYFLFFFLFFGFVFFVFFTF